MERFNFLKKFILVNKEFPGRAVLVVVILLPTGKWVERILLSKIFDKPEEAVEDVWNVLKKSLKRNNVLDISSLGTKMRYKFISLTSLSEIPKEKRDKFKFFYKN